MKRLLWVVMITSAENRRWPGDIPVVEGHDEVGLPVPSLVRPTKIATIDASHADRIGSVPDTVWTQVESELSRNLGLKGA